MIPINSTLYPEEVSMKMISITILGLLISLSQLCNAQSFDGTYFSNSPPAYLNMPYVFQGSENYWITVKTDPEVIRALVPEPLQPLPNSEIKLIFAKHRIVSPIRIYYHEVYIMTVVSFGDLYAGFLPILYLDKIETITPAREVWGYNKVGGDIEFNESDNEVSISLKQMDTLLIKASFVLGESFVPPAEKTGADVINCKYIPSAVQDAPPDVHQLNLSSLHEYDRTNMRLGTAKVEFFSTSLNPWGKIPILEIKDAGWFECSFKMDYGEVIYDYLKETY
jgi:acetoacetate decarboxylase